MIAVARVRRMRRTGKAARPHPGPRVSAQCARSTRAPSEQIFCDRFARMVNTM
jgi:hypothetical protein